MNTLYTVEGSTRDGWLVRHVGTGLSVPHLHHCQGADTGRYHGDRSRIRYKADAVRFAAELAARPGFDSTDRPTRQALEELTTWLREHPWVPKPLRGRGHEYLDGYR